MGNSVHRCAWAESDPLLLSYHDEEWGVPEYESRALWEKLMLDGFQAGLSWSIILRKRQALRRAFKNFIPEKVARFGEADIVRLLAKSWYHTLPGEDRSNDRRCTRLPRHAAVGRRFCRFRVGHGRRTPDPEQR